MDNKFYIEDFEQYLKEKSDEFRMYPSQRVWNSIYNNMHPGSRWPSISMSIILICALFLVGFLNTSVPGKDINGANNNHNSQLGISLSTSNNPAAEQDNTIGFGTDASAQPVSLAISSKTAAVPANKNSLSATIIPDLHDINFPGNIKLNTEQKGPSAQIVTSTEINRGTQEKSISANEGNAASVSASASTGIVNFGVPEAAGKVMVSGNSVNNLIDENNLSGNGGEQEIIFERNNYNPVIIEDNVPKEIQASVLPMNIVAATTKSSNNNNNNNLLSEADKYWIENYAMYNRPAPKKWKGKLNWENYIAPSVVYRKLEDKTANKNAGLAAFANSQDINNSITNTPSFGVELGTGLQYELSKHLKFKTGVQLNFTRYNAQAYDNGHPAATSITMNSNDGSTSYQVYRTSPYNSNYGLDLVKLHNQTLQLSLPVGLDIKLASVDNLEWYAGATIQPTLLLGGQSYLISTDRRNYVKESDMLNRFNLNAGFETFIAIKTSAFTWQIGPQFRTQLFSTNGKIYSVQERLLNYGLKVGIVKKL